MKSLKVRLVGVVVPALLVLGACGGSDDGGGTSTGGGACDSSDPVTVGFTGPLTGASSSSGELLLEGVEMAVEDINAGESPVFGDVEPGILGRCVEVTVLDDQADATLAAQNTSRLVERDEVDLLFGSSSSAAVASSLEIAGPVGLLTLPNSSGPIDYEAAPGTFRLEFTTDQIGPSWADWIEDQGYDSAAIVGAQNAFGTAVNDSFVDEARSRGIEVTSDFYESGAIDLTGLIASLRNQDPDVVVMTSFGADAIVFLNARTEAGWDVPILGTSGLAFPDVIDAVGEAGMEGVSITMQPLSFTRSEGADGTDHELAAAFLERYRDHRGESVLNANPGQASQFYDGLFMFKEAIEAVGEIDPVAATAYLVENDFSGTKGDYVFEEGNHDGATLDSIAVVVADSLEDGTFLIADDDA